MPSMVVTSAPSAASQHGAGFYGFTVHMNDTGATLAGVAADMSACQRHGFADEADEKRIVGHVGTDSLPVQREFTLVIIPSSS